MRDLSKYKGIFPAFYACYDKNGEVSANLSAEFAQHLINSGAKGLYVGGSSGECIYQSVEERMLTLSSVMSVARDKVTVIAHVACNNTRDSQILAAYAESIGVDAIAAIPPIYFHLPEYAIADYWNDISAAAPNTDFFIYNIPQLAGVALTKSLFTEMMKNPRMVGVKNSSLPTMDIQLFKSLGGDDYVIFNGADEQLVSGYAIGAEGGIGGTYGVMPKLFLKLESYIMHGERLKAIELQNDINSVIYMLCSCHGNMYAVIKEVFGRQMFGIGGVRKPLQSVVSDDIPVINDIYEKIELLYDKYSCEKSIDKRD